LNDTVSSRYSRVSDKDTEGKRTHNQKLPGNNPTSIVLADPQTSFREREIDFRPYRVV